MNLLNALDASGTGMSAQRLRMNLISSNLANLNTTKTKEGTPYIRKDAVFEAVQPTGRFDSILKSSIDRTIPGVKVSKIIEDDRPFLEKYDPGHPDANEKGYVLMPNINIIEEMVNMISASRSFEANATAVRTSKEMAMAALEIGR